MSSAEILHIGKYDVVGVLGRGGMGVVYRAVDNRIGRKVAIKTLTKGFGDDPEMLARFYDEAKRTGRLTHPNIVTVYDLGDHNGLPYIVMECVEGEPLDKVIRANTQLPLVARLKIIEEVCCALGYAHHNNVIHRDVKPANIFVQTDGVTKLLDFGIARLEKRETDTGHTRTGHIIGTVPYMAPERLRDEEIDSRSDIFSAGVVLYQLLAGHLPFAGEDVVLAARILNDPYTPLKTYVNGYPPSLDLILDRALAKDPADRFSTAEEMAAELTSIITDLRHEQVLELFPQARQYAESRQYTQARAVLQQLLRIDSKHTGAKQLLSEIQQQFAKRNREEKLQQIFAQAQDALREKRFDQGIALIQDGLKLDSQNVDLTALLDKAQKEKRKKERVDEYLREADTARRKGDFGSAIAAAQKALKVDSDNSKIVAVFNQLVKEAESSEKRASARRLLDAARSELAARRFVEAVELLKEVEKLDASDPELPLLVADANAGLEQFKRRRTLEELQERASLAASWDDVQSVARDVQQAMESMPAEASLFRMKAQLDRQIKELQEQRTVEEVIQSCRSLPAREALDKVRQSLQQLPGNERLLLLESLLADRVAAQTVDDRRAEFLLRARDALGNHMYTEAARILESCDAEGIGNSETTALLEFARREEAEHRRRELLKESLFKVQALVRSEEYEDAISLLQPLLEQIDDTGLRKLLQQSVAGRDAQKQRVESALQGARNLVSQSKPEEAIRLLESQPGPVLRSARVKTALVNLNDELRREIFRSIGTAYAALENDIHAGEALVQSALVSGTDSPTLQSVCASFDARKRDFADNLISQSIYEARASLKMGYRQVAVEQLQSSSGAIDYANPDLQAQWHRLQRDATKTGIMAKLRNKRAK